MMNSPQVPDSLNKITIGGTLILAIVICIFVLVFLILKVQIGDYSSLSATRAKSQYVDCPLQQLSCTINTTQGQIKLEIERPIESLIPFTIALNTSELMPKVQSQSSESTKQINTSTTLRNSTTQEALTLEKVKLRFEGLDDYMGITELTFRALTGQTNHLWQTQGSIPVCTTESNMWRVTINLQYPDRVDSYWFKLKTP